MPYARKIGGLFLLLNNTTKDHRSKVGIITPPRRAISKKQEQKRNTKPYAMGKRPFQN
jgi:hypothetical protein